MAGACPNPLLIGAGEVTDSPADPWFAVQVWAGREKMTSLLLRQKGHETFLPCYKCKRRWSDRIQQIEIALFAGYLFCRLDPDAITPVITTPGVLRVLGTGRNPTPVSESEVDSIKNLVASGVTPEYSPYLVSGRRVRILSGPLSGVEGILLRVKKSNRLVVSVTLLQRSVSVEVEAGAVYVQA